MDKVYLSKSKYCKAKQCNKILWMDKYKLEEKIQTATAVLNNFILTLFKFFQKSEKNVFIFNSLYDFLPKYFIIYLLIPKHHY